MTPVFNLQWISRASSRAYPGPYQTSKMELPIFLLTKNILDSFDRVLNSSLGVVVNVAVENVLS